jgi:hypothetical protein
VSDLLGRVIPNPGIVAKEMDQGAILMDASSGDCFELNAVGARVWSGIEQARGLDDIARELSRQYGVPVERIRTDIDDLLSSLIRCGVVRPAAP